MMGRKTEKRPSPTQEKKVAHKKTHTMAAKLFLFLVFLYNYPKFKPYQGER